MDTGPYCVAHKCGNENFGWSFVKFNADSFERSTCLSGYCLTLLAIREFFIHEETSSV